MNKSKKSRFCADVSKGYQVYAKKYCLCTRENEETKRNKGSCCFFQEKENYWLEVLSKQRNLMPFGIYIHQNGHLQSDG